MELTTHQHEAILDDYLRNKAALEAEICATCGENMMVCAWDRTHNFLPQLKEAKAS